MIKNHSGEWGTSVSTFNYPNYETASGYMTDGIRSKYIIAAVESGLLPVNAHRMEPIISLCAPDNPEKPIQFWQLYSVLGDKRIHNIVSRFYDRVFADEPWFTSVFERVASQSRHVMTQSSMWIDVMGGGPQYHGAEFRLNFHHTHNAMELMNTKGATRWVELMNATLDEPDLDLTSDTRVRPALNTFLSYFMSKYADDFNFENTFMFGEVNQPDKTRINFLKLTSDQVEALPESVLREELLARRIDVSQFPDKQSLVNKALSL